VVAPPSRNGDSILYTWFDGLAPKDLGFSEWPDQLFEVLQQASYSSPYNNSSFSWGGSAPGVGSFSMGPSNATSTDFQFASGVNASTTRYGEFARACGTFSGAVSTGPKSVLFVSRVITTDNTPTNLFLNQNSARLTIPAKWGLFVTIKILGMKSDGSTCATFIRKAAVKNVLGVVSLIGSVETIGTDESSGTSISVTADDTTDSLNIEVTGISGETWRWAASIYGIESPFQN
jgi:hypothetical protein